MPAQCGSCTNSRHLAVFGGYRPEPGGPCSRPECGRQERRSLASSKRKNTVRLHFATKVMVMPQGTRVAQSWRVKWPAAQHLSGPLTRFSAPVCVSGVPSSCIAADSAACTYLGLALSAVVILGSVYYFLPKPACLPPVLATPSTQHPHRGVRSHYHDANGRITLVCFIWSSLLSLLGNQRFQRHPLLLEEP